jgi:hypothetical protein
MTRPFAFLFSSLVCALAGRTAADAQRGHRPDWFFLNWAPGHTPYVAPEDMAFPIEQGSDIVLRLP